MKIVREPFGSVLVIGAFNFPLSTGEARARAQKLGGPLAICARDSCSSRSRDLGDRRRQYGRLEAERTRSANRASNRRFCQRQFRSGEHGDE